MANFVPGQRWISETEPELGLGTIIDIQGNRVSCLFIASSERRTYAAANAPLARVRFAVGDSVESVDGWTLQVARLEESEGLITYHGRTSGGEAGALEETELNHYLQFNKPLERLFTGQLDSSLSFRLRLATLQKQGELQRSEVRGFCGARTSLIPHQLYIAHEVANRHAPRVLLADEVGLGKTIEAGLIVHQQLLTGRADRVLILVPAALQHQWLVEMRRRFNLRFSLFDDDRFAGSEEDANPFLGEQLVLCDIGLLDDAPDRQQLALDAGWDLIVVDEAHHLQWSPDAPSEQYRLVEALASAVPGLLLLTATPEQLGKESHFARLRLLDPDRFYSFEAFLDEERHYEPLARLIDHVLNDGHLDAPTLEQLRRWLVHDRAEELLEQASDGDPDARQELVNLLLDRHGTGRILFRNTRETIKGFPRREAAFYPLPWPPQYQPPEIGSPVDHLLFPERHYRSLAGEDSPPWWRMDPRVPWLIEQVRKLRPAKVLVICAKAQTAIDLEDAIRTLAGIPTAVFHEGLSIFERDRAAAWFADDDDGAQLLVCSEIGSEGRNFQFAHHLVLFDLPLVPDQLEQRIGRLDRIGQTETIRLHVPYLDGSAQAVMMQWYRDGLDLFDHNCPAGPAVFARLRAELEELLRAPGGDRLSELIARSGRLRDQILGELHDGRDRLLELNSCRADRAEALADAIRAEEAGDDLWDYLEQVLDVYGVAVEEHSDRCHILLPGDHMRVSHFPELPEDGITVTVSRAIALAREDMLFLTWEHPMVSGAMDLILNSEHGNAAFALVRHDDLEPGKLLLEAVYQVECAAPRALNIGRYLHQGVIRRLVDSDLADLGALTGRLEEIPGPIDKEQVAALLRAHRKTVETMLGRCELGVQKLLPGIVADSVKAMLDAATAELKRLAALRKVNPSVRQEELDQLKQNAMDVHGHLQASRLRLDAVRVLLST
ncbi:MAG: RNA polymerase-associated protein RapA [Methylococcaceae bacterium]|nr:RNA polymerase-associated protein RapA [Methylococcaceae bacterium]